MSAALPVVTFAQGGPIEVVCGTGVGFVHPVGDIHGYAESIVQILRDPTLRSSLGAKGRESMLNGYNWRSVARKIIDMMGRDRGLQTGSR